MERIAESLQQLFFSPNFRVYTNQNANAIARYVEALAKEVDLLSHQPAVPGRELKFVYFGGGTPSYLSSRQLRFLRDEPGQAWVVVHCRRHGYRARDVAEML